MPGGLDTFGTDFPRFTKGETDSEKIDGIHRYLFMMTEQLSYILSNLGKENFRDGALEEIAQELAAKGGGGI